MTGLTPEELHQYSLELMYQTSHVVGIIPQSMVYGVYLTLMMLTSWVMLKKGLKTRTRRFLFTLTVLMFAYATLYWAMSITALIMFIKGWFLDVEARGSSTDLILKLFSAIGLINYVITDGIVVWRAWILCRDDNPRMLVLCIAILVLASASVVATIGVRISLYAVSPTSNAFAKLTRAIDIVQVANLGLSLITNIMAVSIVAAKAWRFRQRFMEVRVQDTSTRTSRIMALLIESGVFYCISLSTALVATLIRLPTATVGDLYTPVNIQLAGMYPLIVLLLVNRDQSLDKTIFVNLVDTGVANGTPSVLAQATGPRFGKLERCRGTHTSSVIHFGVVQGDLASPQTDSTGRSGIDSHDKLVVPSVIDLHL